MSDILFSYASIIFADFYFGDSKEIRKTRVIKVSWKLRNLQYYCWRAIQHSIKEQSYLSLKAMKSLNGPLNQLYSGVPLGPQI